jgi:glycosyltransferase involved in cell wall biosynthesis
MKKVLISAFACQPNKGSEFASGWNWCTGLAKLGYEVHCLTLRSNAPFIQEVEAPANLYFHYTALPLGLQAMYKLSQATMYIHYILWQRLAYKRGKTLHRKLRFDVVHHVSWGSIQMGSFLYKLNAPFVFGPAGGGQKAPEAFKKYFLGHWASEIRREKVADLMIKYNPACKKMLKNAHAVLVSNNETMQLVKDIGAKHCFPVLDQALPDDFFPEKFVPKAPVPGSLKMLWVGRFMPRKGLLLTLDVMNRLKQYPNITLTIVGDGEMKEEVVNKIKEYGLENTVKLTGMLPFLEVKEYYSNHDIFFFTSLRDSGPAQLTEAMAYGLPIVSIKLHGQGIVINDETGIRCKCDTPEIAVDELEKAIIYLFNNPEKVTAMSKAAYQFAGKQTWSERISSVVKQYYPAN